ncbi:MAG: BLUF domain-containing protein [Methylicorpusculum sp.]|uniref:BLUF domain-containing protein n=1 Tax=Methylicorpusculum sp. TaxID=2713644 RepID=UPI0027197B42|nr:BLUF domain-containing protein [Methylicorpusculum sp.]MDO8941351.1 BLUF domain-containing protein [Methylicorpusculum sp.]MDP2202858.1 BLUF domain-containing protein [Methylicorpusculum sp.]
MIRLLYFSNAMPGLSDDQVRNILQSSRKNNPVIGVTGVLIYGGDMFMQVLEGPEQAVLRLYVKLLDDRRHSNSQIVQMSYAKERMFQNWSMGVIKTNPLKFEHIKKLLDHRLEAVHAEVFAEKMREFVKQLNAEH